MYSLCASIGQICWSRRYSCLVSPIWTFRRTIQSVYQISVVMLLTFFCWNACFSGCADRYISCGSHAYDCARILFCSIFSKRWLHRPHTAARCVMLSVLLIHLLLNSFLDWYSNANLREELLIVKFTSSAPSKIASDIWLQGQTTLNAGVQMAKSIHCHNTISFKHTQIL